METKAEKRKRRRRVALNWWRDLGSSNQLFRMKKRAELTIRYFGVFREQRSLCGKEIQIIYEAEMI